MGRRLEDTDPAKVLRVLERLADPFKGGSQEKIARVEEISRNTVKAIKDRYACVLAGHLVPKGNDENASKVPETFEEFLPLLKEKAYKALNVSDDDIKNATLAQRGIFFGITLDKSFILEGRDTMKISVLHEHRYALDGISQLVAGERERRALPEFIEAENVE